MAILSIFVLTAELMFFGEPVLDLIQQPVVSSLHT